MLRQRNELNGPSDDVYDKLNLIRNRVGMPHVDVAKYNTQDKLRELIRRERSIEMAGEGLRRADILRWEGRCREDVGRNPAEWRFVASYGNY